MAQTVDEIAEILEEMRASSIKNSQDLKETLESVVAKLKVLAENSEDNLEIKELIKSLCALNFRNSFEEISTQVNEIKETFEKSSKINYNSLLLEITNLSKVFSESFAYLDSGRQAVFVELKSAFQTVFDNLQHILEGTDRLNRTPFIESIDELSEKITGSLDTIIGSLDLLKLQTERFDNTEVKDSIEQLSNNLKESLYTIVENQQKVVTEAEKFNKIEDILANISLFETRFNEIANILTEIRLNDNTDKLDDIKFTFENIQNSIREISTVFESTSSNNVFNIMTSIKELAVKFDELKLEFDKPDYSEKILDAISNVSLKLETLSLDNGISEKLDYLKECFARQSSEIEVINTEQSERISQGFEKQSNQIKTVFDNINEIKLNFTETVENLKSYFKEIDEHLAESNIKTGENFVEKLTALEAAFSESSENYDEKLSILHNRIAEFVNIVENSNSDAENKITLSLNEIGNIKDELIILDENLKSSKISSDEKFNELTSVVETNIENIVSNIKTLNDNLDNGISTSIKESVDVIDNKFSQLTDILNEIKSDNTSNDIITDIYEKITSLKDEFTLINTDITALILNSREETSSALENLKKDVSEFVNMDFEKILTDLKGQLEQSFTNFSVDINTEMVAGMESVSKLEQLYKETFNKLEVIEDYVGEKIQNDIELLHTAIESGIKEIKLKFDESVDEKFDTIKTSLDLALNDTKIENSVNELKDELLEKFETVIKNDNLSSLKQDEILSGVSTITDTIKSFVMKAAQAVVLKCNPNSLAEKLDNISGKVETLVQNDSSFEIVKGIDSVNTKLESIVSDTLNSLNAKVDILAADNSDLNILNEIDDIKEIIFEQRKFFEASSDEKAAAVDKYLKDVLLKLDSVDIEKNSEDIKETILNALLSVVDQISFVEETEELKDFVEEKTDTINKNLADVKEKLKKLVNPDDDDFAYVYTLQDVESDIARLRLAINNMQGNDYSDITEEIGLASEQIEKLKDDIVSISTRTNKLLLNSDESSKVLNDGLNNFNDIIQDNQEITQRLERKLDNVEALAQSSANADKVFHQTMMYLGEWIDATTENIKTISDQSDKIPELQQNIDDIKSSLPETSNMIESLKPQLERQEEKIEKLEEKLGNLEEKLEEILSKIEDNSQLQRKTEKIEKLIISLSANIEKLTSYVDE